MQSKYLFPLDQLYQFQTLLLTLNGLIFINARIFLGFQAFLSIFPLIHAHLIKILELMLAMKICLAVCLSDGGQYV